MKKIRISIENPCHEDWDNMTPETQGRFCNSCEKIVVDFTHFSDSEILQYFAKPKTEKICGRFNQDQLTPKIAPIPIQPKPSMQLLHFTYILIVVLGVGITSCNSETTQGEIRVLPTTSDTSQKPTIQSPITIPTQESKLLMGDTTAVIEETNVEKVVSPDNTPTKMGKPKIERIEPQIMGECIMPFEEDNRNQ